MAETTVSPRPAESKATPPQPPAAWGTQSPDAATWPAQAAVLVAIILYATLPDRLSYAPRWLLPVVGGAMLIALSVGRHQQRTREGVWQRWLAIALIAVLNAANIVSLALLIHSLVASGVVAGHGKITARDLLVWSSQIWITNVIVFALWYWELDRGGPMKRCDPVHREPDFLFPQMANPSSAPKPWSPSFVDYLYTSFTNATAFSPTDTMPLTEWAKLLMMVQSLASLLTVLLVTARAVNILNT